MNGKEIIGGVSPLKARQASRGGKHAGKATAKKGTYLGGRGGYAKSVGVRGGGGANVAGYNVQTRFKSRAAWTPPASGGTTIIPERTISQKTIGDPLSGTEYRTLPGQEANISGGTYDEVWDANKDNFQDKWESKEEWIKQAEKEKAEGYYVGEGTDPRDQYRNWQQKNKDSPKTFEEWQDVNKK